MAAFNIVRTRENIKPGRRVVHFEGTFSSTDTTATLNVPKGNIIDCRGQSVGTASIGNCACSDTPSNGVIVPTASGGNAYINISRDEGASGTAYFIMVEYDSN